MRVGPNQPLKKQWVTKKVVIPYFFGKLIAVERSHIELKKLLFPPKKPTSLCGVGFFMPSEIRNHYSIPQPFQCPCILTPVFLQADRQIKINFCTKQ